VKFNIEFQLRLQGRMEQMRRFRRQHEQLRAVIMRVLGPNLQALTAAGGASGDSDRGEVSDLVKATLIVPGAMLPLP
jgi:hypothetical protein